MHDEELSALMDDELPPPQRTAGLDALCADRALRRTWSRYHLIGEVLRDEVGNARRAGASAPAPVARNARLPVAGLALAAALAALAVLVAVRAPDPSQAPPLAGTTNAPAPATLQATSPAPFAMPAPVVAPMVALAPGAAAGNAAPGALAATRNEAADDPRLRGYLVNFNEQRARRGVPGVHPYVRIVGFEAR